MRGARPAILWARNQENASLWRRLFVFSILFPSTLVSWNNLAQVVLQFAAACWMAQFAQRLGFNLSDALACDSELLPYFF